MNREIDILLNELKFDQENNISSSPIKEKLENIINELINTDFEKLISILYRIDISETKLKTLLNENRDKNAATLIADLIIERQLQKIKTRKQFSKRDNDINENDKW